MKLNTKKEIVDYLKKMIEGINDYSYGLNTENAENRKNCIKGDLTRLSEFVKKNYDLIVDKKEYTPSEKYSIKFGCYEELIDWCIKSIHTCSESCSCITSGNVSHNRSSLCGQLSIIVEVIIINENELK